MPIRKINLLGICWLYYANRKAVKYAVSLSRLGSYSAITNLNVQLLTARSTIGIKYLSLTYLNSN